MSAVSYIGKVLRSRVLAVRVILAVGVWTAAAVSLDDPGILRLDGVPFFALCALLAGMTLACTVERVRQSARWFEMLSRRPAMPIDGSVSRGEALSALRELGLTEWRGASADGSVDASRDVSSDHATDLPLVMVRRGNGAARVGSPLFHAALVLLMVSAGAGALVRQEGVVMLAQSREVVDRPSAYVAPRTGGAWGKERYSGVRFKLETAVPAYRKEGVEYGPAPRVRATTPGGRIVEQWIHPNAPLETGSLTVHAVESGPVVLFVFEDAAGGTAELLVTLYPRDEGGFAGSFEYETPSGIHRMGVEQREGQRVALIPLDEDGKPMVGESLVARGAAISLEDGVNVWVQDLLVWATVRVVDDPTVPYVYAALMLICIGAALALFLPMRAVRVEWGEDGAAAARILSRRVDPTFGDRVRERLNRA